MQSGRGVTLLVLTMAFSSLVPRPPSFFLFFGLRSVYYTEAEEREKRGRPGNTYHVNDVWWTRGGRRGGRGPRSNNVLNFIIERSNDSQDSWGSQDWQYSTSPVRISLYRLLHTSWLMGNAPPTSTSRPPNIIHVIGVPRPSPFFTLFRFCVLYWTKTKEQKTGEAWERG